MVSAIVDTRDPVTECATEIVERMIREGKIDVRMQEIAIRYTKEELFRSCRMHARRVGQNVDSALRMSEILQKITGFKLVS
jgi:hypothetical protein